jgi:hypothetical protein
MSIKKNSNDKIIIDGNTKQWLEDAAPNLSIFVSQELESMEARLREFKERELYYAEDCPIDQSDPEGCQEISYKMFGRIDAAKFINGKSTDLPAVNLYSEKFSQDVKNIGNSFNLDYFEMKHAQMAGISLEGRLVDAARKGINRKLSDITYFGGVNPVSGAVDVPGLYGILNNPNVTVLQAATGATTAGVAWEDKNSEEIMIDISTAIENIINVSKGEYKDGFTMLCDKDCYSKLKFSKLTFNDSDKKSLYDYILESGLGIDAIKLRFECAEAGLDGNGRVLIYRNDSEVLAHKLPMSTRPVYEMKEINGLQMKVPCVARSGGVVFYQPMAMIYIDAVS